MKIHQLSVSHDEIQDRLLVRLNTQAAQEFRFWLTRRMVLRFLPAMDQTLTRLEAAQPGVAASDHNAQQILADIKRDAFLKNADFETPYAAHAEQLPLGPEPLLVTDVQLTLQPHGNLEVIFRQKKGEDIQSCHLNLQTQLVHGLIHLLRETMAKAEWDMVAYKPTSNSEHGPTSASNSTAYKH
jgi:hypothetical protein